MLTKINMKTNCNWKAMLVYEWLWSNTEGLGYEDVMFSDGFRKDMRRCYETNLACVFRDAHLQICRRTEINILLSVSYTAASHLIFFCLWCWCWTFPAGHLHLITWASAGGLLMEITWALQGNEPQHLITSPFKEETPKTTNNPPHRRNPVQRCQRDRSL